MAKYKERILDESIWLTATPTPAAKKLPFYVTEAGHFMAERGYLVRRERHDSFLLLYTVKGCGNVRIGNEQMALEAGQAVVLDCHKPHEYASCSLGEWDFLWMHFHGREPEGILEILYPDMTEAITVTDAEEFRNKMSDLMYRIKENDVISCMEISAGIHELLNLLKKSGMEQERIARKKNQMEDVEAVLAFIRKNYASPITVEDMVRDIHVSKYHFIRMFGRKMGVTPYHYLMNYRINQSKMLLGTTDKTIEMIAQECGFSSASNFIAQFKKQTGQKPLQYRKDFIML